MSSSAALSNHEEHILRSRRGPGGVRYSLSLWLQGPREGGGSLCASGVVSLHCLEQPDAHVGIEGCVGDLAGAEGPRFPVGDLRKGDIPKTSSSSGQRDLP